MSCLLSSSKCVFCKTLPELTEVAGGTLGSRAGSWGWGSSLARGPCAPLEAGSRGPLFPQKGCLEQPQPWRLALLPEQCPHEALKNISCAQGAEVPAFMCLVLPGRDIMGAQEASMPASPSSQVDNSGLTLPRERAVP